MEKKCKIVLLFTDKESKLFKNIESGLLSIRKYFDLSLNKNIQNQHLYILSDDEIKEGDWVYDYGYEVKIRKSSSIIRRTAKKIIATTNPDLNIRVMEDNEENTGFGGYYIWENSKIGLPKYISRKERDSILKSNVASIDDDFIKEWINNPVDEIEVLFHQFTGNIFTWNNIINCKFIQTEETWDDIFNKLPENLAMWLEYLEKNYEVPKQITK